MTSSPALNGSLTHEPDRFSDAAWDLLLSGQDVARRWRHEQLDVEHLIQVLFTDPACRRLVERLPLPIDALLDRLEDVLADQPSGRGEELFIGDDLEQLLDSADAIRRRWNGDVIDLPEVLMAIGADPRIGADLFAGFGLSADALEQLIQRGMDDRGPGMTVPPQERSMPRAQPEVQQEAPRRERVARVPSSSRAVRGPAHRTGGGGNARHPFTAGRFLLHLRLSPRHRALLGGNGHARTPVIHTPLDQLLQGIGRQTKAGEQISADPRIGTNGHQHFRQIDDVAIPAPTDGISRIEQLFQVITDEELFASPGGLISQHILQAIQERIDGERQALHQAAAGGIGEQHLNQVLHIQLLMAPATGNVLTTEQQIPGRVAEAIRLMGEAAVQRWR